MSLVIRRGAAGMIGALGIAVLTTTALAQSATSAATSAINAKRNSTRLPAGYYARPVDQVPQRATGDGAYQYFSGNQGKGAIYWSSKTGAHLIYGPILNYFERNGHEEGIGYPVEDPLSGPGPGCVEPDTVRRQSFTIPARVSNSRLSVAQTVLCEGPRGMVYLGARALSTTTRPQIEGASRTARVGDTTIPAAGNDEEAAYDDEEEEEF